VKGIVGVLSSFGHEQYLSNNVNPCIHPWCLIIKYLNEGIGFLVRFNVVMKYLFKFQKICYKTEMTHPKLLDILNYKSKGENNERIRGWGTIPGS